MTATSGWVVIDRKDKTGLPYLKDAAAWIWQSEPHFFCSVERAEKQLDLAEKRSEGFGFDLETDWIFDPLSSSDFAPPTSRSPGNEETAPEAVRGECLPVTVKDSLINRTREWDVSGVKVFVYDEDFATVNVDSVSEPLNGSELRALSRALKEAADALEGR